MSWHDKDKSIVLSEFKTNPEKGLSSKEVYKRIKKYGVNKLEEKKQKSIFKKILEQLTDFMVLMLIAAAIISFITSALNGEADILEPIIILVIVIINTIMGVLQENKAEKAIEALQKLASPMVKAVRDGNINNLKSENIVPGDIIFLEAGDLVPADCRLIESVNLKCEEASLTGESVPSSKNADKVFNSNTPLAERRNMVFSTGVVTSGRAKAVVTATGMKTEVGHIANMLISHEAPQTPLQSKLEHTGKVLSVAAICICAVIFILGLIQQKNPIEMFMIAISLAVAAIPEGLPAIVTIVLAMGVMKMVKKNAIIRKLPAVETLGSATVICSDKTGTLTLNKMTVTEVYDHRQQLYEGSNEREFILSLCSLCNNTAVSYEKGKYKISGEPTEKAFVDALYKSGIKKDDIDKKYIRVDEIPFDSDRKLMTTVHKLQNGKYRIITKGAPEILINLCDFFNNGGNKEKLTEFKKKDIADKTEYMSKKALRVLAAAYKDVDYIPDKNQFEKELIFCGLVGMIDPPRPEVINSVMMCKKAGIKPVMITGDHVVTAMAIAKQIGIMSDGDLVLTCDDLNTMSQRELEKIINKCSVFARVTPEHKARIVKAFQSKGHVVAMTGDGVNDAPALKIADIGCAMGITGTDVAKGASDMILTDDNFATIVQAVKEGRGIFKNIKKAIHFLLSSNIGEIITIFTAFLLGIPTPLLPIQLLWVNLVTDSLPALALGVDSNSDDIMNEKPINSKRSIFSGGLGIEIALEGMLIGGLALLAYTIGRLFFDLSYDEPYIGRTMAFCVLSLSQLVHAFNTRSEHSIFKIGLFSNKYLVFASIICAVLQISVVCIAPVAAIFKVVSLNLLQWAIVAGLAFIPMVVVEISKLFTNNK